MKSYSYIARDLAGQRKEGLKQAACSNDVLAQLREQGLIPVAIKEISAHPKKTKRKSLRKRIKSAELAALCWQLNTMLEGGIPITTALGTIAEDIENVLLQQILQHALQKMEKGEPFSSSVSEFPNVFNKLSVAMILAGEVGGNLPQTLKRLAEYFDNRDKLARKVKGAMAYPVFVLTFIILIVIFIMAFIVPRFQVIFSQIGGRLPAFTRGFMAFYDMLRHNIVYILGTLFLIVICGVLISKTKKGHHLFCRIALATPLFGRIFSQAFVAMFCRTMSTLLAAGVSVLEVFDILSKMTSNDIIRYAITRTRENIVEGSNISLSLAASGFFPNMVVKMVQVGEESGSLSRVLDRTSVYYERKVDSTITTVMSMLEPIMIVTVGAIVLVVVLALYLPIFSMSDMAR
jgi:type IV pilus assembly protein PilC